MEDTAPAIQFFTGFQTSDLWYLAEAATRTLLISTLAISIGTLFGCLFGWMLSVSRVAVASLGAILDVFRSVPLIIQLILFYNFFPIVGFPLDPFAAGTFVLIMYTSTNVPAANGSSGKPTKGKKL